MGNKPGPKEVAEQYQHLLDQLIEAGGEQLAALNKQVDYPLRQRLQRLEALKAELGELEKSIYRQLPTEPEEMSVIGGIVTAAMPSRMLITIELPSNPYGNRAKDGALLTELIDLTISGVASLTHNNYTQPLVTRQKHNTVIEIARLEEKVEPDSLAQGLTLYAKQHAPELFNRLGISIQFRPNLEHRTSAEVTPKPRYQHSMKPGSVTSLDQLERVVNAGYRCTRDDIPHLVQMGISDYTMATDTEILDPSVSKRVWAGFLAGFSRRDKGLRYRMPQSTTPKQLAKRLGLSQNSIYHWTGNDDRPLTVSKDGRIRTSNVVKYLNAHPVAKKRLENKGIIF